MDLLIKGLSEETAQAVSELLLDGVLFASDLDLMLIIRDDHAERVFPTMAHPSPPPLVPDEEEEEIVINRGRVGVLGFDVCRRKNGRVKRITAGDRAMKYVYVCSLEVQRFGVYDVAARARRDDVQPPLAFGSFQSAITLARRAKLIEMVGPEVGINAEGLFQLTELGRKAFAALYAEKV